MHDDKPQRPAIRTAGSNRRALQAAAERRARAGRRGRQAEGEAAASHYGNRAVGISVTKTAKEGSGVGTSEGVCVCWRSTWSAMPSVSCRFHVGFVSVSCRFCVGFVGFVSVLSVREMMHSAAFHPAVEVKSLHISHLGHSATCRGYISYFLSCTPCLV